MGFQVSDRNERGMIFLRNGSDHHTVALVPGDARNLKLTTPDDWAIAEALIGA